MGDSNLAKRLVESAIRNLNSEMPAGDQVSFSPTTPLIGPTARLDSLGLVSLIAFLEGELRQRLEKPVSLVDERGLDPDRSPFRTVATLTEHVASLLP